MKKATFIEGTGIALISSIAVAVLFTTMSPLFFGSELFRLLVAGLSFFYILYLFLRSEDRTGRVTVMSVWFVVTLFSLVFVSSLLLYIVIQLLMIWLMRSLYFYNSIFSVLIDLSLTGFSLLIAIWSWSVSGSLFLTFWCFFLVQALFVFIPKNFIEKRKAEYIIQAEDDRFESAYHTAEIAVSKLINSK